MKTIAASLFLSLALGGLLRAADAPAKDVFITANDQMKFSVTSIEARPGEMIHIQLKNEGTLPKAVMGHNWVLLKAGKDPVAYASAAISGAKENFQPKQLNDQVLAAIALLGPKQQGEVTFAAPDVPGHYAFLCSFPAHCQAGMRGELIVK